jgi:phosphoribosylamine---glycine ligase
MGTLAWYDSNEKNKLFLKTLEKLKPYLKEIDFRGDIDLGCIVNEKGIFPLEATPRFGSPIIHLQCQLHKSPWFDFLKAIADGKSYNLKWRKGYGVVVMISTPPFPYTKKLKGVSSYHTDIHLDKSISPDLFASKIHFEEVSFDIERNKYYVSDHRGYVMYVTSVSKTISKAAHDVYKIVRKIHIPKMFYRNDIGSKFEKEDILRLIKWGYLEMPEISVKEITTKSNN